MLNHNHTPQEYLACYLNLKYKDLSFPLSHYRFCLKQEQTLQMKRIIRKRQAEVEAL